MQRIAWIRQRQLSYCYTFNHTESSLKARQNQADDPGSMLTLSLLAFVDYKKRLWRCSFTL